MPFKSEKQRRYLWANEPEIARDWTDTYGSRIEKNDGGIMDVPRRRYFSGAYGQGAGDRGGDPRASRSENIGRVAQNTFESRNQPVSKPDPTPTVRHHSGDDDTEAKKLNITRERDAVIRRLRDDKKAEATEKLVARYARHKDKPSFVPSYLKALGPMAYLPGHKAKAIADRRAYANSIGMGEWFNSLSDDEVISTDMMNFLAYGDSVPKGETYADYQADKGSPGLKYRGNVGNLEKFKKADGTYGYKEITGGEGPIYYPGYVPGGSPVSGGGGGTTAATTTTTPSAFQQSLTTGASSPFDYHVGQDPTAANLAWGEKFNVDPRTMYKTSWAADGGRIPAAFGGIMDSSTGRRAYGFGSFFKKIGRAAKKVLKSPIAKGALMAGLGAYGMGWGPFSSTGMFSGAKGAGFLGNMMSGNLKNKLFMKNIEKKGEEAAYGAIPGLDWGKLGIWGASALPFILGGDKEKDEDDKFDYKGAKSAYQDEIMRLRRGVMAGNLKDAATQSFLPVNYREGGRIGLSNGGDPLLREEYDKYVFEMNELGIKPMSFEEFLAQARAGMYAGGQSTPSDYTMEDAMMTTTQDKLGGITDVMKQADLHRQGSVGQFYAAQGGRIGYDAGGQTGHPPITTGQVPQAPPQMPTQPPQRPHPMPAPQPNRMAGMPGGMNPMMNRPMMNPMGGRRMAQEGGLMDLGGMEKDYRNDGGFVPLGGEEKADDVPARLSKNEFVFTADAVRGAGDGDIDKGAEIMENIMKNLEQGGQISEETQGLSGAQEMFGVSERLGEVL